MPLWTGSREMFSSTVANYFRIAPQTGHEYDSIGRVYLGSAPADLPLAGPVTTHLTHADSPGAHHGAIYAALADATGDADVEQVFAGPGGIPSGASASLSLNTAARDLGAHWLYGWDSSGTTVGGSPYVVIRDTGFVPDLSGMGTAFGVDDDGMRLGILTRWGPRRIALQTDAERNPAAWAEYAISLAETLIDWHLYRDTARWGTAGIPLVLNLPYYALSTSNVTSALNTVMAALPSTQTIWLEGDNEPGGSATFGSSNWEDRIANLATQVAATSYASRINLIGPSTVNFTPNTELAQRAILSDTATADLLAAIVAHVYNAEAEWRSMRDTAERHWQMRVDLGIADRPFINTETGSVQEDTGAGNYGHQTARNAALMHFHVKAGGAPETLFLYRLKDGGSSDYRGYYASSEGAPSPVIPQMAEYGAQLRGTIPFRHQTGGPTPLAYTGLGREVLDAWTVKHATNQQRRTHVLPAVDISDDFVMRYDVTGTVGGVPGTFKVRSYDGHDLGDYPVTDGVFEHPGPGVGSHLGFWIEHGMATIAPKGDCLAVA